MKLTNTRRGFTLIELLVVVLIISILAAVALPQYQKARVRSQIISALPLMKAVYHAQKAYYLEHGAYATSAEQLDIEFSCPKGATCVINKSADGSGIGTPKMEIRFNAAQYPPNIILYYGAWKMANVDVEGRPYCVTSSLNARGVSICKSFGPAFVTNTFIRVFIEP